MHLVDINILASNEGLNIYLMKLFPALYSVLLRHQG